VPSTPLRKRGRCAFALRSLEFAAFYAREAWLDDMIDITDRDDPRPIGQAGADQRAALDRVEGRARRYGDKIIVGGDGVATAYQRVRAAVVEDWLDDMIEIVDDDKLDPLDKRVRIDARRWIMSKVSPQRYGDKVIIGGDGSLGGLGGAAVSLSDEQWAPPGARDVVDPHPLVERVEVWVIDDLHRPEPSRLPCGTGTRRPVPAGQRQTWKSGAEPVSRNR
jgi:hypothetical protein